MGLDYLISSMSTEDDDFYKDNDNDFGPHAAARTAGALGTLGSKPATEDELHQSLGPGPGPDPDGPAEDFEGAFTLNAAPVSLRLLIEAHLSLRSTFDRADRVSEYFESAKMSFHRPFCPS